ncbi:RNA chaperone/antiterminator CspA [Halanaerocella petrolearia]
MQYGRVKYFNTTDGQGVIEMDNQEEVIVNSSNILPDEDEAYATISPLYNNLPQGAKVAFEVMESNDGLEAKNVVKL